MKAAHILHLRPSGFVGGPERQLFRYAELDRAGLTETILGTFAGAREGCEFLEAAEERGFRTLALPTGSLGDCAALPALVRVLKEREIALLCTHGYQADIMGIVAGLVRHVPVACFLRGWTWEDWKVQLYEALDRAFLPLASRVVCLSETQGSRLARRRSLREKTRVVVNAIETRTISEEERVVARREICRRFNLPQDSALVATAGRLSPEKGADHFIEAVPAIREPFPAARFLVFGDGPLRVRLERLARELCPTGEVYFTGHVPDFPQLLPGIDVLVNPSLSEQMPNVVLEAMAVGIPVVATNVGGVAEIAGDGGLVLIPPSDSAAIVHAVTALLSDPSCAREQGRAGQRRVQEAFSPERQRAQLRVLYEELIPSLKSIHHRERREEEGSCLN